MKNYDLYIPYIVVWALGELRCDLNSIKPCLVEWKQCSCWLKGIQSTESMLTMKQCGFVTWKHTNLLKNHFGLIFCSKLSSQMFFLDTFFGHGNSANTFFCETLGPGLPPRVPLLQIFERKFCWKSITSKEKRSKKSFNKFNMPLVKRGKTFRIARKNA